MDVMAADDDVERDRAGRPAWTPAESNTVFPRAPEVWTRDTGSDVVDQLMRLGYEADVIALHALHALLRRMELNGSGLAVRGSMVLRAWAGESFVSRQPKDIDLVTTREMPADEVQALLRRAAAVELEDDEVVFDAAGIGESSTWPYSEVPGIRFQVPWELGHWRGAAQVDVALDEKPPITTVRTSIPGVLPGLDAVLDVCTPELSLAWKLRWLCQDAVAQAKDCWDALCLVRHVPMNPHILEEDLRAVTTVDGESVWDRIQVRQPFCAPLNSHWLEFVAGLSREPPGSVPRDEEEAIDTLLVEIRKMINAER